MTESIGGPSGALMATMALVQQRLVDDQLLEDEYRAVIEHDHLIEHSVQDSQAPTSLPRNRYVNVLPYDYNRVKLGSNSNNYINASGIHHREAVLDGMESRYIAMQGPLQNTVGDFWRMVLEQGVEHVVMLTNPVERGIIKCTQYYPEVEGDQVTLPGGVMIHCLGVKKSYNGDLTVRKMEIRRPGRSQPSTFPLMHYQYHAWPDHGTPNNSLAIRGIAKIIHQWRVDSSDNHRPGNGTEPLGSQGASHSTQSIPSPRPVVVHCSAGIGRTGTFIVVDIMRQRLQKLYRQSLARNNNTNSSSSSHSDNSTTIREIMDLPALVCQLRLQRMGMVQTFEQYIFCYQAIYEELTELLSAAGS